MAPVLCYIAHADTSHYELNVCFHLYRGTHELQKLFITEDSFIWDQFQTCTNSHLHVILVLLCICCLLHVLDRQKKKKKRNSSSQLILFYPVLLNSVVTEVKLDQLRCQSRRLLAVCPSGFLNALRSSLHPEDCLPVCTHTRRIWPRTLTSCQTQTHTHIYRYCFLSCGRVKIRMRSRTEPPARCKAEAVSVLFHEEK